MSRKKKIALFLGFILVLGIGLAVGSYLLPDCPVCPDCPECQDCPECPECPSPLPSTITIEKWVQNTNCACGWQKSISAEKGDWIMFRIVVNVTQTMKNVWVRDVSLVSGPWARTQELQVDGVPISGDIAERISLGELTNESKEITFQAQLSKSIRRYDRCGINILNNLAEAGNCGFEVEASTNITVDVYCAPKSRDSDEEDEIRAPKVKTH